jgi:hypothetical protein
VSQHVTVSVWHKGEQITWLHVLWPSEMPLPDPDQNDVMVIGRRELSLKVTKRIFFMRKRESRVILRTDADFDEPTKGKVDEALRESFFLQ